MERQSILLLHSSMSPKVDNTVNFVRPFLKAPSKLALKKYFRKSSVIRRNNISKRESVIVIESSSSDSPSGSFTTCSSNVKVENDLGIKVIEISSESEEEEKERLTVPKALLGDKFQHVEEWVKKIEPAESTIFTEVSSIRRSSNTDKYGIANSTPLDMNSRRFNELFRQTRESKKTNKPRICSSSEESDIEETRGSRKTKPQKCSFSENSDVEEKKEWKKTKPQKFNCSDDSEVEEKQMESRLQKHSSSEGSEDEKKQLTKKIKPRKYSFLEDSDIEEKQKPKPQKYSFLEDSSVEEKQKSVSEVEDIVINDSFRDYDSVGEKDSDDEPVTPYKDNANIDAICENFLDSVYGDSWRSDKDKILPKSEPPKKRTQKKSTPRNLPKTEKKSKLSPIYKNPYLEVKSSEIKKPEKLPTWRQRLRELCDLDTDSDESPEAIGVRTKLNFGNHDLDNKENENVTFKKPFSNHKKEIKCNKTSNDKGTLSFLASLAGNVPLSQCDSSARVFRSSFKEYKVKLAEKLFKMFNENIFDGSIPADTQLEWNPRLRGTAGRCHCKIIIRRTGETTRYVRIVLSTKVLDSAERLRNTLVHEMCHAAAWVVDKVADGHGPLWRAWADKAVQVFPEIPPLKRCHDYKINTKYTYKCTSCGYSIGRHSKSLNTEKKRCGLCGGKFEVYLNKQTKTGENKVVPATPKKQATAWSLFVKEHYAAHKTPDLKHGDVMKVLGQKFSNIKLTAIDDST